MANDDQPPGQKKGLGVPLEVARQQLLESQDTKDIAESLGMDISEYVELVLEYATTDKEPEVKVYEDEDLAEMGAQVPTAGEIMNWFKGVESGDIQLGPKAGKAEDVVTKEKDRSEKLKEAAGIKVDRVAPKIGVKPEQVPIAPRMGSGSILKKQLLQQQAIASTSKVSTGKGKTGQQPPSGPRKKKTRKKVAKKTQPTKKTGR